MLFHNLGNFYLLYCMHTSKNRLTCPICRTSGLLEMSKVPEGIAVEVCGNEYYSHWSTPKGHFLVRNSALEEILDSQAHLILN